jgi:chromosome segregation ATPase
MDEEQQRAFNFAYGAAGHAERQVERARETIDKAGRKLERATAELDAANAYYAQALTDLDAAQVEKVAADETLAALHGTLAPYETVEAPAGIATVGVEGKSI